MYKIACVMPCSPLFCAKKMRCKSLSHRTFLLANHKLSSFGNIFNYFTEIFTKFLANSTQNVERYQLVLVKLRHRIGGNFSSLTKFGLAHVLINEYFPKFVIRYHTLPPFLTLSKAYYYLNNVRLTRGKQYSFHSITLGIANFRFFTIKVYEIIL